MKKSLSIAVVGAIILLGFNFTTAQTDKGQPFVLSSNVHYGFLIPHRVGMKNLITGHIKTWELNYEQPTDGSKPWHHRFNYPSWGFLGSFIDLGNPKELGYATTVYPFFLFPVIKKEKFQLLYRVGSGLVYINKPFDLENNYKNIVIGSRFNAIISMYGGVAIRLSERLSYRAGLAFTHFSNGASSLPNLGINTPSVSTGVSYRFGNELAYNHDTITHVRKQFDLHTLATLGSRQIPPPGGKNYAAFGLYIEGRKHISSASRVGLSMDFFYNNGNKQRLMNDTLSSGFDDVAQLGLFLSYQIRVWRVTMLTGLGVYTYNQFKREGDTYERIGSRFHLTEKIYLNMILKSHKFRADFIEWGIGVKLMEK